MAVNSNAIHPVGNVPLGASELVAALAVFLCVGLLMFITAPTAGDFSWSDAPRHAMNGIFIGDFLRAMPLNDPKGWAVDYYLQYPALTILFYPPLFSLVLAGNYSLFGFSHEVAQATVSFFHFLLGFGVFVLSRRWMSFGYAVAAALMLAAAPEISYWGRQVMLDIPAYAWLAFMAVFFVRYLDRHNPWDWYLTLFFYLLALYTKQTPVFVAGALFVALLSARGVGLFRDRHIWLGAILFAVAMIPLLVIHVNFGQINTASVMGSERADASRLSLEAWSYYIAILPSQLGWPTVIAAVVYLVGAIVWPQWRIPKTHMVFLGGWFLFGYLMFSFIMVRQPRHDLMALLPFPVFAALGFWRLSGFARNAPTLAGSAVAIGVGLGSLGWSVFAHPVSYVKGYGEAAEFVMKRAPENGAVLFHGYRDGNFTFHMRAGDRPDLSVARSDKMLLRMTIERARGVVDRGFSKEQIEEVIQRYGIRYVVAQTGFWSDLASFGALASLLADESRFRAVDTINTQSNFNAEDKEIVIYQYLGDVRSPPEPMSVEMVGIGQTFEQK